MFMKTWKNMIELDRPQTTI